MDTVPALFVSHGSPMLALQPGAAGAFLQALGPALEARFGRPRAILALSAHTLARVPTLLAAPQHHALHDFGGFDPRLHQMAYDTPGAPELAARVQALLATSGISASVEPARGGLDHGLWIPLRTLWPQAGIPVLPLAWPPHASPTALFELGQALAPLRREGVLVLASGGLTYNLRLFFDAPDTPPDAPEIEPSRTFRDWVAQRSQARDWQALQDYRARAPHAAAMHPTDEHWLPWYVAAGAGGPGAAPQRLFEGASHGMLGMDAYAFGQEAAGLRG